MTSFEPRAFPLQSYLGMTVDSPEPGTAVAVLDVTSSLHNPNGVVHGAALFAMVDTSMGAATMSTLADDETCATVEVHLRFLRPVAAGRLVARTEITQRGRRIVQLESRVVDADDRAVASASGSFAIIGAVGVHAYEAMP